jgi:hypothetical protein
MAETFVAILTAHLLGDFVLQTSWMVEHRRHLGVLLLHGTVVTLAAGLLMGSFHLPILLAILLTHLAMDAIKAYLMSDSLVPFLIDQLVHLAVLVALACLFPHVAMDGWWATGLNAEFSEWYFASLSLLSGLILAVPAGGIIIEKATSPLTKEIGDEGIGGLTKGGLYIGWLERFLVMLLVLINQPAGIGFLIAAKSILRFGEIKDASQRKLAEYIIIGTFLSFAWALTVSVLTQHAIHHWLPPKAPDAPASRVIAPPATTPPATTRPPTPSSTAGTHNAGPAKGQMAKRQARRRARLATASPLPRPETVQHQEVRS